MAVLISATVNYNTGAETILVSLSLQSLPLFIASFVLCGVYLVTKVMAIAAIVDQVAFMSLDPVRQHDILERLQALFPDLGHVPGDSATERSQYDPGGDVESFDQCLLIIILPQQAKVFGEIMLNGNRL